MKSLDYEQIRISTLHSYQILDTPRDARFDAIVQAIHETLNVPFCGIAFYDESRVWFKASIGMHVNEMPRGSTLATEMLNKSLSELVIPDTHTDPRSRNNYIQRGNTGARAFAGIGLFASNGQMLGSINCFDYGVRDFTRQELDALHGYGAQVMELLENRKAANEILLLERKVRDPYTNQAESISTSYESSLRATVSEFSFECMSNFGWFAAQAWWHGEAGMRPAEWQTPEVVDPDFRPLVGSLFGSVPVAHDQVRYPQPTIRPLSEITWLNNREQLEKLGASHVVLLDLYGNVDAAIRMIFLVPNQDALTPEVLRFLRLGLMLLPKVIVREKARDELQYRAEHDPLTGLINVRGLAKVVAENAARSQLNRAVYFIDLDRFKAINDKYGHGIGDELLIHVADSLTSSVRPNDTVARVGGDEFVILTRETQSYKEMKSIAERIFGKLCEAFKLSNGIVWAGDISIGAALWEPTGSYESSMRVADGLMYQAKKNGGGFAVSSPEDMASAKLGQSTLRDESVFFTPIKDEVTGDLFGVMGQVQNEFRTPESRETARLIVEEFHLLKLAAKRLVLRLPHTYWLATDVLVELVVILKRELVGVELNLLVGEEGLPGALRDTTTRDSAMFARAATKVGIVLARFGSGSDEFDLVQKLNPVAVVLDHAMVASLATAHPASRTVRVAMASAAALQIPILVPQYLEPDAKAKIIELGCQIIVGDESAGSAGH